MQPLQFLVPVDALAAFEGLLKYVILGLVLVNMVTRIVAHQKQKQQAASGDHEDVTRWLPHSVTTLLLVLASFAFLIVEPHGGMVMSVLVLGVFVADLFEFESRKVEVRNDMKFEQPKAAITASLVVLLYAAYQSLFFLVADYWELIV